MDEVASLGFPRIASLLAGVSGRDAGLTTVQEALHAPHVNALDYTGVVGDGVNDDTAGLNAAALGALGSAGVAGVLRLPGARSFKTTGVVSIPAGVTVVADGAVITLGASVQFGKGASWRGGSVRWTVTTALDAFVPVADYVRITGVEFIGSGAIGSSGNPLYQRGVNATKYNYVQVESCRFTNMTVGVWVGGSSLDATPVGARVRFNSFENIVGYRGESEGYGVLLTPGSDSVVVGNVFNTIARHAIYLAGGACRNVVASNVIDTVDNVGIQMNTFQSQPASDGNVIAMNRIQNVTRSIAYGYASSVGIGVYGNNTNTSIIGNRISGYLDRGVDWSSASTDHTTSVVGFGAFITGNMIDNTGATDSCIRVDNPDDVIVAANSLVADQNTYGIVTSGAFAPAVGVGVIRDNTIRGKGAGTTGVRIAASGGAHRYTRNVLTGAGVLYYAGGAGGGFSIESVDGYIGIGDNDYTYAVGTSPRTLHQTTTLTAARTLTLSTAGASAGTVVDIARPSAGAFGLAIVDANGSVTLKTLSSGQWARAMFDGTHWQLLSYGSL